MYPLQLFISFIITIIIVIIIILLLPGALPFAWLDLWPEQIIGTHVLGGERSECITC